MESDKHMMKRINRYDDNVKQINGSPLTGLTVVEICISEMCTRTCSFCPRSDKQVYPNRKLFMSDQTAENLARSLAENVFVGDIHISGFGESMTNKNIYNIINILRDHLPENRIALTSNGDLLDVNIVDRLVDAGLSHMIISCYDGPTEYEVFNNMLNDSKLQSYEIRELWLKDGESTLDMINRNNFNNRSGAVNIPEWKREYNLNKPCYLPFYKMVIDWNGSVVLCCNDWLKRHGSLGNINDTDVKNVWLNEQFTQVRNKLKKGDRSSPACKYCNIQGDLVGEKSVNMLSSQ